ncbi:PAPA-1-like conserved region containing protein [Tanacetum coccineum]
MDEFGVPRFDATGNTFKRKSTLTCKQPKPEEELPESHVSLSSTPPSDDAGKISSDENGVDANPKRKVYNLNQLTITEGEPSNRVQKENGRYSNSASHSNGSSADVNEDTKSGVKHNGGGSESKIKKVKLKVAGVTQTIQPKSNNATVALDVSRSRPKMILQHRELVPEEVSKTDKKLSASIEKEDIEEEHVQEVVKELDTVLNERENPDAAEFVKFLKDQVHDAVKELETVVTEKENLEEPKLGKQSNECTKEAVDPDLIWTEKPDLNAPILEKYAKEEQKFDNESNVVGVVDDVAAEKITSNASGVSPEQMSVDSSSCNSLDGNCGLVSAGVESRSIRHEVIAHLLKPHGWKPPVHRQFFLDCDKIADLCVSSERIFSSEPSVLQLRALIKIFGDLHGQFGDTMRL